MDVQITEQMIYLIEKKLPVYSTFAPNGGMTSPMSLLGTLTLANAEFLALGVLMQMVRPGTYADGPGRNASDLCGFVYYCGYASVLSTIADMRDGSYAPGGIETGILQMAHCQMARFYNVPSGGYIGLTNAHLNDAESGYETGMSTTAALLGGADMFNMGGLLGSLMSFDFAKAVIDSEISLMLKRMHRGLEFSTENLCLDVIAKVGPGGTYMEEADTFERMRTTAVLPKIAIREMRDAWHDKGSPDTQARALDSFFGRCRFKDPNPL
jgi:trimethylamine--corrinoid protein Co-methyltransferase